MSHCIGPSCTGIWTSRHTDEADEEGMVSYGRHIKIVIPFRDFTIKLTFVRGVLKDATEVFIAAFLAK